MKRKVKQEELYEVDEITSVQKLLGTDWKSFNTMLEQLPVSLWMHDENYTIVYANQTFKDNFGNCVNQKCYQCLMGKKSVCKCCQFKKTEKKMKPGLCKICKRVNVGCDINILHTSIINKDGQRFIIKSNFLFQRF